VHIPTPSERFAAALAADDVARALYDLAVSLRDNGHSQRYIYDIFRSGQMSLKSTDSPEYDSVLDVMDLLVGYGRPEACIFDSPLAEDS